MVAMLLLWAYLQNGRVNFAHFCRQIGIDLRTTCGKAKVYIYFQCKIREFFQSPWQWFWNFSIPNNLRLSLYQDLSIEPYMNSLGPTLQRLQGFPEPDFIKEMQHYKACLGESELQNE